MRWLVLPDCFSRNNRQGKEVLMGPDVMWVNAVSTEPVPVEWGMLRGIRDGIGDAFIDQGIKVITVKSFYRFIIKL